ncbi:MAG: DNA polymerase III subunit delta [Clostridiaceae bacterium]|jgi:DNA polymerase-3 subunit delta|nr:DNA polymerase III subunit delta [Clostridiaceae bacterium]
MKTITLPELNAAVKRGEISPLYIIKGEDAYFKSRAAEIVKGLISSDFAVMNLSVYESRPDMAELLIALSTEPVFSEHRAVLVSEWTEKLSVKEKAALNGFFENPPEFSVLAVFDGADAFSESIQGGAAAKFAVTVDCKKADRSDIINWIKIKGARAGVLFDEAAAVRLAEFTRCDMTRVATETEKIIAFSDGRVSVADIESLVVPELEVQIFELANALSGTSPERAWGLLSSIERLGYKETHILGAVTAQFRRMYYSAESDETEYALAKKLGVKEFSVCASREAGRRYRPNVLKRCVEMLDEQEFLLKSGKISKDHMMRDIVARLISAK